MPLRDNCKGLFIEESVAVQKCPRVTTLCGTRALKSAFKSRSQPLSQVAQEWRYGDVFPLEEKASFRAPPPLLCPSLPPSGFLPKHTGHPSVEEKHSASSPSTFNKEPFPSLLFAPFASRDVLEQREGHHLTSPVTRPFPKRPGPPGSSLSQAVRRQAVAGKGCLEPSAGPVPRACCFKADFGFMVFI